MPRVRFSGMRHPYESFSNLDFEKLDRLAALLPLPKVPYNKEYIWDEPSGQWKTKADIEFGNPGFYARPYELPEKRVQGQQAERNTKLWLTRYKWFRHHGYSQKESAWAADKNITWNEKKGRELAMQRASSIKRFSNPNLEGDNALRYLIQRREQEAAKDGMTGIDINNIYKELSG